MFLISRIKNIRQKGRVGERKKRAQTWKGKREIAREREQMLVCKRSAQI